MKAANGEGGEVWMIKPQFTASMLFWMAQHRECVCVEPEGEQPSGVRID